MNKYWNNKLEMPKYVKAKLKSMVKNIREKQLVTEFCINNNENIRLFKISGEFAQIFDINRKYLHKGNYTAPANENDYSNSDNYVTENGLAGFSITKKGWLISLYSNQNWKGFAEYIKQFVNKANKLVFINTSENKNYKLLEIYQNIFGFETCAITLDDTDEMIKCYGNNFVDDLIKNNGEKPYHIFMVKTKKKIKDIKEFTNYYTAYDYVDNIKTKE